MWGVENVLCLDEEGAGVAGFETLLIAAGITLMEMDNIGGVRGRAAAEAGVNETACGAVGAGQLDPDELKVGNDFRHVLASFMPRLYHPPQVVSNKKDGIPLDNSKT